MDRLKDGKPLASTFIHTEDFEIRIEKLQFKTGQEKVRLSTSIVNEEDSQSLLISEDELLDLLNQAIHAGVLPRNFFGKLRDRIEI